MHSANTALRQTHCGFHMNFRCCSATDGNSLGRAARELLCFWASVEAHSAGSCCLQLGRAVGSLYPVMGWQLDLGSSPATHLLCCRHHRSSHKTSHDRGDDGEHKSRRRHHSKHSSKDHKSHRRSRLAETEPTSSQARLEPFQWCRRLCLSHM